MKIYNKIFEDYKDAMKSQDEVRKQTLNYIIVGIRSYEKKYSKEAKREINFTESRKDENIIMILKETARERLEMAVDLIKIDSKDKEILKQVEGHKKSLDIIINYLPHGEIQIILNFFTMMMKLMQN